MSSVIDNIRGAPKALPNYQYMDLDATTSQASLNIPEDNGKRYRAEQPGFLGVNVRFLFFIIAIIFFILSLILFIGTIVAYYNRPSPPAPPLKQSGEGGGVTTELPVTTTGSSKNIDDEVTFPPGWLSEQWSLTTVNDKHVRPGQLVWSEDFTSFNRTSWYHLTGDSNSYFYFNVNNVSNSFAKDGKLFLKPTYTEDRFGKAYMENGTLLLGLRPSERCHNTSAIMCWKGQGPIVHPIMAPMISSKNFFRFRYGKLVISAKMPSGDWIEPIISLQPYEEFYGINDLQSGQIHFVDTRGNRQLFNSDGLNVGSEQNCPDIRYGHGDNKKVLYYCVNTEKDEGFDRDFHLYELEWTPEKITLKIDGEGLVGGPYPRPSMFKLWSKGNRVANPWENAENPALAPFDKSFYLTLGMNVGGVSGYFNDDFDNKPYEKPWNNSDPNAAKAFWDARNLWEPSWSNDGSAIQIDFIRLYALNETLAD